ncbi:MAG: DNA-binding protein WhiA [Oscillospiraceae bacterium]|nr:DNA-binding protein WhiA [Oscillospiraceae bacterium]
MSFSSDVKLELLRAAEEQPDCCAEAQLYGLLLFGREFHARSIRFSTESRALAEYFCASLHTIALAYAQTRSVGRKWEAEIVSPGDCLRVLERFGHAPNDLTLRVIRENFIEDGCAAAFLRGAFLACAAVTTPQRQYHLEFTVGFRKLAGELCALLKEAGHVPKLSQRKGVWVLYYKDSTQIEELLTYLGAQRASLNIMGVKMEKDVRNHINRQINFETANMTRTAAASVAQCAAIRHIRAQKGLESLPDPLRQAALLREENPEASLQELCELAGGGVTRSGMNHRLRRLVELAEQLTIDACQRVVIR